MTTFRFDAGSHEYIDASTGVVLPHITGLLHAAGLVDDQWFTEESCERGIVVHRLTADFDLGALVDVTQCVTRYKGYLAGHAKAMEIVRPTWHNVEIPRVHPVLRFGGRPDRDGLAWGMQSVLEVKAAIPQRSHQVQTALQAILVAPEMGLPPRAIKRFVEYLKPNGKFKIEEHKHAGDFTEAERIIRRFAA